MVNILIVEDEPLINSLVKHNRHTYYSAFDGNEVLLQLSEREYDLIILDIMTPQIDGFKVVKQSKGFEGETRKVDVHIQKLRKKLIWDTIVQTVYKLGYRLEVNI